MSTLSRFILVVVAVIASMFLNGFMYLMMYNYGIVPIINYFCPAPEIPYNIFIVFGCAVAMLNINAYNQKNENSTWTNILSVMLTKLLLIGILVIANMIFV